MMEGQMPERVTVSAADLVRNFGVWQEKALNGPVFITHHRRERLVLQSIEQYSAKSAEEPAPGKSPAAQAPAETQEAAVELAALLENMSDAYMLLDPALTVLQVNARLEALWSVNREQLVGRNFHDLIPPHRANLMTQKLKRVLLTRQPETAEFVSLIFPGAHLLSRIYPHPRGVVILQSNQTELAALRLMVTEAESLKNAIARHPYVAHLKTDPKGRFTYSDETTQAWSGFDAETLSNTRISDICAPEDRRRVLEAIEDVVGAHVPSAVTARILGRDFSEHEVQLSLAPIIADQNASGVSIIATAAAPRSDGGALGEPT
jgi:PAS domain S-box-containing protein